MPHEDHNMQDAAEAVQDIGTAKPENKNADDGKITVLTGSTVTAASFCFRDEDHTLGNALRHIIMKNPDVEFCGYSIPHPAEPKMHLRIQTYDGVNAQDVLEKGLDDLMGLCDVVIEKFEEAREGFEQDQMSS